MLTYSNLQVHAFIITSSAAKDLTKWVAFPSSQMRINLTKIVWNRVSLKSRINEQVVRVYVGDCQNEYDFA